MILVFLLVALLITLFLWSLRAPRRRPPTPETISACEQTGRSHATYLHVIRQALAAQDLDYLRERGYRQLLGRVRHERRHAALVYLAALRGDFRRLLLFARVIASLSPEVQVAHEFQRLRLMLQFSWRFELIRIRLFCNAAAVAQLASLGEMVSALNIRLEAAIKELSERAALAGEIASSLDRRGLDGVS